MRITVVVFVVLLLLALAVPGLVACQTCNPCQTCPQMISAPPIGAGPAAGLADLCGCAFDTAFTQSMAQQYADILALACWGRNNASSPRLRDLSGQLAGRQPQVLQASACGTGCGTPIQVGPSDRVQCILSELSRLCGLAADRYYATAMIGLMQQTQDTALLAKCKATTQCLQKEAAHMAKQASKEIRYLNTWLNDNSCGAQQPSCVTSGCYR